MSNGTICNTKNGDIDDLENERLDYDLETSLPDGSEESDDTSGIFSLDVSDNEQKNKFWNFGNAIVDYKLWHTIAVYTRI